MENDFKYPSLEGFPNDTIRILSIQPSAVSKHIQCQFSYASLSESPKFLALSYTWGDPLPVKLIELDGKSFAIRQNLWDCLAQIRQPTSIVRIWADAISINQKDIDERNSQVKLMGNIYSSATSVVAWLGKAETSAGRVLQPYLQVPTEDKHEVNFLNDVNACWWMYTGSLESRNSIHRVWDAILHLCQRPYWTRRWIIQEIALAKNVIICYGAVKIPWLLFASWCRIIEGAEMDMIADSDPLYEGHTFHAPYTNAMRNYAVYELSKYVRSFSQAKEKAQRKLLADLVFDFHYARCSDPRDSIYALLSMASDQDNSKRLEVDYHITSDLRWTT
ncbi:Heterokaryon incompatibility protein (HET) domain containing protein [Hyaloscypha variabilis]